MMIINLHLPTYHYCHSWLDEKTRHTMHSIHWTNYNVVVCDFIGVNLFELCARSGYWKDSRGRWWQHLTVCTPSISHWSVYSAVSYSFFAEFNLLAVVSNNSDGNAVSDRWVRALLDCPGMTAMKTSFLLPHNCSTACAVVGYLAVCLVCQVCIYCVGISKQYRVTTCLENLEMSWNLTAVREMLWILLKIGNVGELSGKKSCHGKLPKTVYCKLHICVYTRI